MINRLASLGRPSDERGQGLVEYALILALVSLAAIVALGFLSTKINGLFSKAGNSLNSVQVASGPPGGGSGGDTTPPTVTNVTTQDDNDGRVEEGESIVITFSEALNLSTLCGGGGWTGGTLTNQANVLHDNDPETITVTSAGGTGNSNCTGNAFNFGSLALSGNFLSSDPRVYEDSTISWSGTTLTITLDGSDSGGSTNTVASATLTYTPSSGITDVAGNPISGGFTTATAEWF